jgi:hypothetical protein
MALVSLESENAKLKQELTTLRESMAQLVLSFGNFGWPRDMIVTIANAVRHAGAKSLPRSKRRGR